MPYLLARAQTTTGAQTTVDRTAEWSVKAGQAALPHLVDADGATISKRELYRRGLLRFHSFSTLPPPTEAGARNWTVHGGDKFYEAFFRHRGKPPPRACVRSDGRVIALE